VEEHNISFRPPKKTPKMQAEPKEIENSRILANPKDVKTSSGFRREPTESIYFFGGT
jgi:hypothetical protein